MVGVAGFSGGILLGLIGLAILWPACSKGVQALLIRFVISVLVKLVIATGGFLLAIKIWQIDPTPLAIGFLSGYLTSMFLEILPCVWKLRQCAKETTSHT